MKLFFVVSCLIILRSHPTWVRGLKLGSFDVAQRNELVAPYVGAWIETAWCWLYERDKKVAPYVGAWIETIGT